MQIVIKGVLQVFRPPGDQHKGDVEEREVTQGVKHQRAVSEKCPPRQMRLSAVRLLIGADGRQFGGVNPRMLLRRIGKYAGEQQNGDQREQAQQDKHAAPVIGQEQQPHRQRCGKQRAHLGTQQADAQ
ncbi:hypothetical protein D3C79_735920 [compost metagenome]